MADDAPLNDPGRLSAATVNGTNGDDTLTASAAGDVLLGFDGNDMLLGDVGSDTLEGGADDDVLDGGAGADQLNGGAGDDILYVDHFEDVVDGGDGFDHVIFDLSSAEGTPQANTPGAETVGVSISGVESYEGVLSAGSDSLATTFQTHDLDGGLGQDLLVMDFSGTQDGVAATRIAFRNFASFSTQEVVVMEDGTVAFFNILNFERYEIIGTTGSDEITTESRGDVVYGGEGDDTINGAGGADTLVGGEGDDVIIGGSGNDHIEGGSGRNQVSGGTGADTFVLAPDGDQTITDFEEIDTLLIALSLEDVRGIIFDGAGSSAGQRSNGDTWLLEISYVDVGTGIDLSFQSLGFSMNAPILPTAEIELEGVGVDDFSIDSFEFL